MFNGRTLEVDKLVGNFYIFSQSVGATKYHYILIILRQTIDDVYQQLFRSAYSQ